MANTVVFKSNVKVDVNSFNRPEVMRIIWAAAVTAPDDYEVTVTCGKEAHAPETRHGRGEAFDVRSKDFPGNVSTGIIC